eukprot:CAMPEP_0197931374 /NCGR_PEP_ID=MMETSP1439-20131203/106997_1 /TAXON_ID=66791 /ORGANISM="Gonyaulax spinifera, Strain CCMP409" /LENGTH=64 /DNA_ID=CAMNT_0043554109 /DNA_START=85 /DNA_END=279 /DNA_ORIENTATION=-
MSHPAEKKTSGVASTSLRTTSCFTRLTLASTGSSFSDSSGAFGAGASSAFTSTSASPCISPSDS